MSKIFRFKKSNSKVNQVIHAVITILGGVSNLSSFVIRPYMYVKLIKNRRVILY